MTAIGTRVRPDPTTRSYGPHDTRSHPAISVEQPAQAPSGPPGQRRRTDPVVDAAAAFALAVLAVLALGNAYGGTDYLVIGAVGAALGTAAVAISARFRLGPSPATLVALVAFVAGAGAAIPDHAVMRVLPTPKALAGLGTGLINTVRDLLTTEPVTGVSGTLGVTPYAGAFAAAALGLALARWTPRAIAPAVPALVLLTAGFVLGTGRSDQPVWQGIAAVALIIGWAASRANRPRRGAERAISWPRVQAGLAMLAMVGAIGALAGLALPWANDEPYQLRNDVRPESDEIDDHSPLGALRSFLKPDAKDRTVMAVTGMGEKDRVRVATMDTYDGTSWILGGSDQETASGTFERVGAAILPAPPGEPRQITITTPEDRSDEWLPTVGTTRSVRFDGDRADDLARGFRYNRSTRTGYIAGGLRGGDTYTLEALPQGPEAADEGAASLAPVSAPATELGHELSEPIVQLAKELAGDKTSAYDKATAIAEALRNGTDQRASYYSDGGAEAEGTSKASKPGHSIFRLQHMVERKEGLIGNAEQYAALMAAMARWHGLPAQVVIGFNPSVEAAGVSEQPQPQPDGSRFELKGRHIDAWVEIDFVGIGVLTFDPTPAKNKVPPDVPDTRERELELSQVEPPPPTNVRVPEQPPDVVTKPPEPPNPDDERLSRLLALLWTVIRWSAPLGTVPAAGLAIVAYKAARTRRRRLHGTPVDRLAGAWRELCDRARDLGATVPVRATRREIAAELQPTWPAARLVADAVDTAMFGLAYPADGDVEAIWHTFETEHDEVRRGLGTKARLRAALSIASLRPHRWTRERKAAGPEAAVDPEAAALEPLPSHDTHPVPAGEEVTLVR